MPVKMGSFSCVSTTLHSPLQPRRSSKISLSGGLYDRKHFGAVQLRNCKVITCQFAHGVVKVKDRSLKRQYVVYATNEDNSPYSKLKPDGLQQENDHPLSEDMSPLNSSYDHSGTGGRPGLITFYNRSLKREEEILMPGPKRNQNELLWFVGPTVLVASFIFPSLYLRRILSAVFEDSLLTDFLILFFTEALFYCGVAVFLLLVDHLRRPFVPVSVAYNRNLNPQLGQRISSVAVLVLSLIIPMVTMGFVWPWTGPAASATLAPYLVGMVVQFAFEQYARYIKSPSWPVIPIIFQVRIAFVWLDFSHASYVLHQVYRLHQLNRAAQLVTALSFTVRGAEMTSHNLAINSSLGTLLNVLQCLGVICIWSLSSFLMRFFRSPSIAEQ